LAWYVYAMISNHPSFVHLNGRFVDQYRVEVSGVSAPEDDAETAYGLLVDESEQKRPSIPFAIKAGAGQYANETMLQDIWFGLRKQLHQKAPELYLILRLKFKELGANDLQVQTDPLPKNRIHIGSENAGPKVAAILSVVESCRRLGLPVRDYLGSVLPGLGHVPMQRVGQYTPTAWAASRR
jgi:hypothetical protein